MMAYGNVHTASEEAVRAMATPTGTNRWSPIPHGILLDMVRGEIQDRGFKITSEDHTLDHDGARWFGFFTIDAGSPDWKFQVGTRNAHDKRFPAGMVAGNSIIVCSNLQFTGEINFGRKHTPNIMRDLPGLVYNAVKQLGPVMEAQTRRFDSYKAKEITHGQAAAGLVRLAGRGVFSSSKILPTYEEFLRPQHEEFKGNTVWNLMNSVTENLKAYNVETIPGRTIELTRCLDRWAGVSAS